MPHPRESTSCVLWTHFFICAYTYRSISGGVCIIIQRHHLSFSLKVCSGSLKTAMDWSICFLFLPLGTIFALTPRYLSTQVLQRLSLESESSICQKRKIPSSSYQPIVIVESRLQYLWRNVTKPLFFSNLFFKVKQWNIFHDLLKLISRGPTAGTERGQPM